MLCDTSKNGVSNETSAPSDSTTIATKPVSAAESRKTAVFAYTACMVASFFGGFKLHLLLNRKRYNPPEVHTEVSHAEAMESPRRFANRAILCGTLVSVIGTGTLVVASYYSYKA